MTRSIMDRRALFATGAAAALLAATGVSAASVPTRGGRLRMALSGAQRSDSWVQGDGLFMQVARQGLIFDTLTEIAADGTLRGELATDWEGSEDGRVWQFDLRQDVVFHDARPLTAKDVAASLALDGAVEVVNSHQIRITLDAPAMDLPFTLSGPDHVIRPAHALNEGIGTGLYRLRRFTPGQQVLAERMADHYKGQSLGWFDAVELVSIPSEPVRAQALAEYLVEAADLSDPKPLIGYDDIALLPSSRGVTHAVSRGLAMPARTGQHRPLDNLRAAERWWFA
ncbi:ABC transporter substrate-binding protein [Roseobacter sp. GAI101]|uniref:ABC transporter substrate-binding protein n=1 Tax=Roseobacter sp. (strain GAI101) TaxID=391589 RepID=UPI0003007FC6|nr:ABC transporter substrate-binding protein [Roseobacter sp. GAI101]